MTGNKYVDIDAALAERKELSEPMVVKLFGRDWELPGSLPAAVIMRLSRWAADGMIDDNFDVDESVSQVEQIALLTDMVPRKVFDAWCAEGLGSDDLVPIIDVIMNEYEAHAKARAEGEAPAPANRGARRSTTSSNGGRSSKPTSRGSTGSRISGKR